MRLTKSEMNLLKALAIVCVIALACFGCQKLIELHEQAGFEAAYESQKHTYQLGEMVELDADKDAELVSGTYDCETGFGWASGTMQLTVNDVRICDDLDAVKEVVGEPDVWDNWADNPDDNTDDSCFLVCAFTLKNIDAALYETSATKNGHAWYSIDFLKTNHGDPVVFFDGMPDEGSVDAGERSYYNLCQGESATYTIVYSLGPKSQADIASVCLRAGVITKYADKYCIELGLDSAEETSATAVKSGDAQ